MDEITCLHLAREPEDLVRLKDGSFQWKEDGKSHKTIRLRDLEKQIGPEAVVFWTVEEGSLFSTIDFFCQRNGRQWYGEVYYSMGNQTITVFCSIIRDGRHAYGRLHKDEVEDVVDLAITYFEEHPRYRLHFLTETIAVQYT